MTRTLMVHPRPKNAAALSKINPPALPFLKPALDRFFRAHYDDADVQLVLDRYTRGHYRAGSPKRDVLLFAYELQKMAKMQIETAGYNADAKAIAQASLSKICAHLHGVMRRAECKAPQLLTAPLENLNGDA